MNYKDYIDLGFERIDTHDVVEFERTGSDGFVLMKKLNKNTSIEVCSGSLNKPKLYIDKKGENQHYSIDLNVQQFKQLFGDSSTINFSKWEMSTTHLPQFPFSAF